MTAGVVAVTGLSAAWPVWLIAGVFMLLGYGRCCWLLAALALAEGGLIAAARRTAGLVKGSDVR